MVGAPVRVPITEDFTITVEVTRRAGKMHFRACIDGVPAADESTAATLALYVLAPVVDFAEEHGDWSVVLDASDESGGVPA